MLAAFAAFGSSALLARTAAAAGEGGAPTAGDIEEARKHYARGVELYEQHADAAALAELDRAYQLAPNWKVLYELAVVELALHDFASSLSHFEQYLEEGKDGVKAARHEEVNDRIAQLRQQVGTIELVTAPGAEIRVDDVPIATAPLAKPLVLNPGHHKLGASKDGLVAESHIVSVAGGDHSRVELVIPAPAPSAPPAQAAPPPDSRPVPAVDSAYPNPPPAKEETPERPVRPFPYAPVLGFVGTGLLASGAIAMGVEALSANSNLSHAKSDGPTTPATLSALSSKAQGFALASDLFTGAAVVALGATLYFTFRPAHTSPAGGSRAGSTRSLATRAGTPGTSASLGIGPGRISIEGSF